MVEPEIGTREYWNPAHRTQHPGALSGSGATEVLQHHRLTERLKPGSGMTVLDIGVGLGNMSRYLHGLGYMVDALDVADAAETTVTAFISRFYLAEQIETLPDAKYDLAISQIVAQHMGEPDLRRQIREVFRALKPGGVFSLHLAGADAPEMNNWPGPVRSGYDGSMCRTPEYAMAMIAEETENTAKLTLLPHRMNWPQYGTYWYWVWIEK